MREFIVLRRGVLTRLLDTDEGHRAWRDVWSGGHGAINIKDVPSVSELVARLTREYDQACALPRL